MEYREQLEYIKTHQEGRRRQEIQRRHDTQGRRSTRHDSGVNKNGRRKKRRISPLDKMLWKILFVVSIAFVGVMAISGWFPVTYLIIMSGVLLSILMIVKILQQRACRSGKNKKRITGRFLMLILIAVLSIGSFYLLKLNSAMEKVAVVTEESETGSTIDISAQPFNIYVSGIDVYGEITKESRSDVNLIVTVNPIEHKILITTTPRDYYVTIPGITGEYKDKLTHAGIYGIEASMGALENLYSTEIPFYARVNFSSIIDIVDAMGGVDVESEIAFETSKAAGTVVEIKEGKNHLNGKEALAFVRERKAFVDGDNQRGKNQQILLTALIKKAMSPMMVFQASEVIDGVVGNAETNLSMQQMKSFMRKILNDLDSWEIESVAATGDDSGKQYCYSYSSAPLYVCVPDTAVVEEIRQKMEAYLSY